MDTQIANSNIAVLDAESHLEARNIHVWFKERHVLSDVSLHFPTNSVTALIGPSGCGKSTFIRTLNRMHELIPGAGLAGSIYLDNEDIYAPGVDPVNIRLRVGMVFQKPNPFPTMTIKGNVLAGLRLNNRRIRDEDSLVESCLNRASIWNEVKDRLDAPAGSLSGGQQQRLCIARSLAMSPEVLLMDEPCSALDPGSTRRIEETIRELSTDMTIVIVTHNMQQAARVADRTAFFTVDTSRGEGSRVGTLVEHDVTDVMFSSPSDQRTLDYVTGKFG